MAKTLELQFLTEEGKTARVTIDNPVEPVNVETVKTAMLQIIADDVFGKEEGAQFVAIKGARVVERQITNYDLS